MFLKIRKKTHPIRKLFLILLIFEASSNSFGFEFNNIIKKICLLKVNSELKQTKKELAEEIKAYSCDCFLEEVNSNSDINQASLKCKEKAINKFNL